MIDTKAVWAGVEQGGSPLGAGQDGQSRDGVDWVRTATAGTQLISGVDTAGDAWVRLPGTGDQTLVLGSSVAAGAVAMPYLAHFGQVVQVETMKALAGRFPGGAPCGVIFAPGAGERGGDRMPGSLPELGKVSAYLELHVDVEASGAASGPALGVVTEASEGAVRLSARLRTLAQEAVEEMTGISAAVTETLSAQATEMANCGVPAAVMFVRALPGVNGAAVPNETRLHLLQAAEAFGRWVEATMHLVAGEPVDLWAVEHRVPHS